MHIQSKIDYHGTSYTINEGGFTSTAAITVFMKTVVRERRIPFEIKASGREQINKEAWEAFLEMRTQAAAAGVQDLTLDEINAEIQNARNER